MAGWKQQTGLAIFGLCRTRMLWRSNDAVGGRWSGYESLVPKGTRGQGYKGTGKSGVMMEADSVESGRLVAHPCAMHHASDVKA